MQIKGADDRAPDIRALEALLARQDVDPATRQRIEWELRSMQAGIKGEHDAAYQIEFSFGRTDNLATIHDLRFEVDGRAAQIDHLILNRLGEIWVCESKHFAEGVGVNEYGEWVRYWRGRAYGIPSPIEQNDRHILHLRRAFDDGLVPLPRRLGLVSMKPEFRSLVLVSNNARISRGRRPKAVPGLEGVMKVERLKATVLGALENSPSRRVFRAMGTEGLETFARGLAAIHRPRPIDWPARFGLVPSEAPKSMASRSPMTPCANCGQPVTPKVEAFCRGDPGRFGGKVFCFDCQRKFSRRGEG
jgi:hypothetical protein